MNGRFPSKHRRTDSVVPAGESGFDEFKELAKHVHLWQQMAFPQDTSICARRHMSCGPIP